MAQKKYILAVDLGTSGPKTAIISTSGEVIDCEIHPTKLLLSPGGGAEQDPDDWWNAIVTTTRKLIRKRKVPVDDIIAVSNSAQWSGTVAVDKSGKHLMNSVIWMDSRGSRYIKKITGGLIKIEGYGLTKALKWLRLTGGAPGQSGKDPIAHILYIKNELPKIYNKTYKFLEPKDYLNLRMTGLFAASYDSITLHWVTDNRDISNIKYNKGLLKMAGLERDKLPDLKRAVDILGPIKKEVARELGLKKDIPVVMGTPDVQAAALGSGAVKDYEAHLYIGTSSWLVCHVPYKKTDMFHSIASLPSAIPDRYLAANEQETAGVCLTWLRDNILYHDDEFRQEKKIPDVFKIYEKILKKIKPGSDGLIFTPWLYGERTPVEDHTVRATLFNLSLDKNREHIVRAVFEGIAFNSKWLLGCVEKFIKRKIDPINIIGGGANSDTWCQIHADIFNRNINQVDDPITANARGAAFLASVAMGYMEFYDIPKLVKIKRTYKPNPDNRKIYDDLFKEFLNIYKCNKKIYSRLNRH